MPLSERAEAIGRRLRAARVAILFGLAVIAVAFAAMVLLAPSVRHLQCDGSLPRWMLEAQHYNYSGCAEVLPVWDAPPGADWSPYCMGMCIDADAREPLGTSGVR